MGVKREPGRSERYPELPEYNGAVICHTVHSICFPSVREAGPSVTGFPAFSISILEE